MMTIADAVHEAVAYAVSALDATDFDAAEQALNEVNTILSERYSAGMNTKLS